jgi:FkbM family methyltransferase
MSVYNALPPLVRVGFLWNRYGFRARGYLPRLIGRKLVRKGEYVIQTKHGAKLVVDIDNLDIYASIFNSGGEWEGHVARNCQRLLRKNDVFFDIGANAGCISLDTRALIGAGTKMYLFEPQPSLANSIKRSIAINCFDDVQVFEFLLGNSDGHSDLYLTSHAIHASMIPRENPVGKVTLAVWKVDTLVATGRCLPPDIVKMDVEGAELQILHGMRRTLEEHSPTILFEADQNMSRFGYSSSDLIELIASAGNYDFYAVLPSGSLQRYTGKQSSDILAVASRHRSRINPKWLQ